MSNRICYAFVFLEAESKKFGNRLASDIVTGWSQSSCHENKISIQAFGESLADSAAIRHRHLSINPQTQTKNLARDKAQVCVENVTEQQFRAGVDYDCSHCHADS